MNYSSAPERIDRRTDESAPQLQGLLFCNISLVSNNVPSLFLATLFSFLGFLRRETVKQTLKQVNS